MTPRNGKDCLQNQHPLTLPLPKWISFVTVSVFVATDYDASVCFSSVYSNFIHRSAIDLPPLLAGEVVRSSGPRNCPHIITLCDSKAKIWALSPSPRSKQKGKHKWILEASNIHYSRVWKLPSDQHIGGWLHVYNHRMSASAVTVILVAPNKVNDKVLTTVQRSDARFLANMAPFLYLFL